MALQKLAGVFKGDADTRGQVNFVGSQARRLGGLRDQLSSSIGNSPDRLMRRLGASASSAAAQGLNDQVTGAVNNDDVVSNALKRAKARVGIVNRGEPAIRNQQLKDRLAQVRSGISSQGRAIGAQVAGRNIEAGVKAGVKSAKAAGDQAVAGAFGGALGVLGGTLKGNFDNNGSFFDFGSKNLTEFKPQQLAPKARRP